MDKVYNDFLTKMAAITPCLYNRGGVEVYSTKARRKVDWECGVMTGSSGNGTNYSLGKRIW